MIGGQKNVFDPDHNEFLRYATFSENALNFSFYN